MIIYLASPYSHPRQEIMVARFEAVCEYAAKLMRKGMHIFSPIAHTHPIAQYGLPKDWAYWQEFDRKYLALCERMIVLKLDGWKESKGITAEIEIAKELGIPIEYHG